MILPSLFTWISVLTFLASLARYRVKSFLTTYLSQNPGSIRRQVGTTMPSSGIPHLCSLSLSPPSGDHAGHICTFSSSTGLRLPVPDHYVPEVLREWGDVPVSLEILTSDSVVDGKLERAEILVLPAVGCGVDNLDVEKRKRTVNLSDVYGGEYWTAFDVVTSNARRHVSTTFFREEEERRIRVDFSCDVTGPSVGKVEVALEKSVGDTTGGSRADGGGLDGRTVFQLCGKVDGWWDKQVESEGRILGEGDVTTITLPVGIRIACQFRKNEDGESTLVLDVSCAAEEGKWNIIRRQYSNDMKECLNICHLTEKKSLVPQSK